MIQDDKDILLQELNYTKNKNAEHQLIRINKGLNTYIYIN